MTSDVEPGELSWCERCGEQGLDAGDRWMYINTIDNGRVRLCSSCLRDWQAAIGDEGEF